MYVPNHVDIALSNDECNFVYNQIETDSIIHPILDLSKTTAPKWSEDMHTTCSLPNAKTNDEVECCDTDVTSLIQSKLYETRGLPDAENTNTEAVDELINWSTLSPGPCYPSIQETHMNYKAKGYKCSTRVHKKWNSECIIQAHSPCDPSVSSVYFDKFDQIEPMLRIGSDYDETSDVGTTYLGNVFCQRNIDFSLEESFSCDPLAWTNAHLSYGTEKVSMMLIQYYMICPNTSHIPLPLK